MVLPKPQSIKIALISDIHWGVFGRDWQLQRVVDKLAMLDVDAVFIAGDWTYEPKLNLEAGFAPLKQITVPIFGVLGNHDLEKPGPKLATHLVKALKANHVQLVEKKTLEWKGWKIIGLNDLWGGNPREEIEYLFRNPASNRLVLTHQPSTIAFLPENAMVLGLAGHSHGGQVLLPFLTAWKLEKSVTSGWYNGLYDTPAGQVFVTPGIGMTNLPFRFAVPPTIDVITLRVP
jgi:predicted MPP superfamily phosphohydrolase